MSNVVQFLETMGRHPALLSDADYIRTVMDAGLDESSRDALLQRDAESLIHALDARSPMFCFSFVATPDGGKEQPLDDDREDEGVETPVEEPTPKEPE
ncbi:hypothetical protein [Marilutibacter alkalisoli]|uniref:Uncharacterized protein n=1 Tax=Marilutibacter alkalisoli TaxID=2591633 RepID=A0A514BW05_9GAMM|nr:hypothetical protein [Lysobacter alkalisoli]QDH71550.1 hypothetical protein FKV23_16700 [Lysobacter alkalisoli]